MLLKRLKLCGTSAGLEKTRVFQEDGEDDQDDWKRVREGRGMGDVDAQKPPRPANTTKRTTRMVREPLAGGDQCGSGPMESCSRSLRVTWMGLPLTPAPLPRAAARFAIAGLGGGASCVAGSGLARLARRSAAIFALRDCGGGGGTGVVSGKGGRASRSDCRLRTARGMEGSRPELARASR
jgi:hypothetical protein